MVDNHFLNAFSTLAPRDESRDTPSLADQSSRESIAPRTTETILPASLSLGSYRNFVVTLNPDTQTFWCTARQQGIPSFTFEMLRELNDVHRSVQRLVTDRAAGDPAPVKFFVCCSDAPGVFNLGGDLTLFKRCIRERDRVTLLAYAYACVQAMYNTAFGFDVPVISIGVVQGEALGGGFEAAISCNVLIAERGVRMGLPEILFNSFPGMGAYSFLTRKLDAQRAEKLILGGRIYAAEELHEMGVVDIIAEPGQGREAARNFIAQNTRRQPVLFALNKVRRKVNALTLQELRDVTEIWVDTMLALDDNDLRRMDVMLTAQTRRLERMAASPA